MKRNIICFFILIFWSLAVCTVLSACIEQQMTAQVTVARTNGDSQSGIKLPTDCLVYRDEGIYFYEVVMGENWESGKRAEEVESYKYWIEEDGVYVENESELGYIQYTSKAITSRERIQVVSSYKGEEESYLIIMSNEREGKNADQAEMIKKLEAEGEVLQQNGSIVLLSMKGKQPYMEAQVKNELSLLKTDRVYCLGEVCRFFENIPLIFSLFVILMISVVLWVYSFSLFRHLQKNRFYLIVNFGIITGLFCVFTWITRQVCLPSSLLPQRNIFELQYYYNEFSKLFGALGKLSGNIVFEVKKVFWKNVLFAAGIILGSWIGCVGIWYLELRMSKKLG